MQLCCKLVSDDAVVFRIQTSFFLRFEYRGYCIDNAALSSQPLQPDLEEAPYEPDRLCSLLPARPLSAQQVTQP